MYNCLDISPPVRQFFLVIVYFLWLLKIFVGREHPLSTVGSKMAGYLCVFLFAALLAKGYSQSVLESLINDVLGPAPPSAGTSQSNIGQGPSSMAQGPSNMAQGPSFMAQGPNNMAQGPTVNGNAFASNTGPQLNSLNSFGLGPTGQQISNFGSSQSGSQLALLQQAGVRPQCSNSERQTLYRSCAMSFGMAHMQYFRLMGSQRMCRPEMFSCSRVDELVRCTNSQPVSVISNRCWMMIRNVLTSFLHQNNVPCGFEDIYKQCNTSSADILPLEQRPQAGRGIDNNPLPNIMPIIMRQVMPMVMMMTSGGGGMFGF